MEGLENLTIGYFLQNPLRAIANFIWNVVTWTPQDYGTRAIYSSISSIITPHLVQEKGTSLLPIHWTIEKTENTAYFYPLWSTKCNRTPKQKWLYSLHIFPSQKRSALCKSLSEKNLKPLVQKFSSCNLYMLPYFMCRFSFHLYGCSDFSSQSNSIRGEEPSEIDASLFEGHTWKQNSLVVFGESSPERDCLSW